MFINMIVMHMMKVAVMEVIDVIAVADWGVPAAVAMDVGVAGVDGVVGLAHDTPMIPQNTCTTVQL